MPQGGAGGASRLSAAVGIYSQLELRLMAHSNITLSADYSQRLHGWPTGYVERFGIQHCCDRRLSWCRAVLVAPGFVLLSAGLQLAGAAVDSPLQHRTLSRLYGRQLHRWLAADSSTPGNGAVLTGASAHAGRCWWRPQALC